MCIMLLVLMFFFFFFQAEDGIRDVAVTGVQTCALPIYLVVYLQAPVDVLLERIARRGVDFEQYIDRQYLERLNEAYARFFHAFQAAPLLIVNAASIDPIANQRDYDELLATIRRMSRGRLYYNPLRSRAIELTLA